jgi:hypothetical protein
VQSDDLGPGAQVTAPDVAANAVNGTDVVNNSLTGFDIANGSIASGDLAGAALGARAYGRVDSSGTLSRSKNVASVTNPVSGVICITLAASIDPASVVLVVGPSAPGHVTDTGTANASVVEWDSSGSGCPAGTLKVHTYIYDGDSTDNSDGFGDEPGDELQTNDDPFAFVVP